eukprot:TRINITY_DN15260_c0_g2_i3.p1 TRINITY_DN15260_c0_g2~~TRINITY_DN15260_c0_g2_i3.p1  ORF type:complete len:430 (+),score=150.86 TRINITY_DN15260_c0_g2_i3:369-1658(+)
MYYSDVMCSVIYFLELLLKVTALGVRGYLSSGWNVLDGIVAIFGILALFPFFNTLGLEPFKLLRPIKLAHAIPQMSVLLRGLGRSIPLLLNVFVLYFFFVLAMGVIAVQQWEGLLLNRCVPTASLVNTTAGPALSPTDTTDYQNNWVCRPITHHTPLGGYYCPYNTECIPVGNPQRGWVSFDHIGLAMLTLFISISLEGWSDVMYGTMGATTYAAPIFWLVLILFGTYFLMNLTLLIITETFSTTVYKHNKEVKFMKKEFMNHLKQTRLMLFVQSIADRVVARGTVFGETTRPQETREKVRAVLRNRMFKRIIILAIFLNTVLLAIEYHGQPQEMTNFIQWANVVLTFVFAIEVSLKLFVGMRRFFKDAYDTMDLCIVLAGLFELIFSGSSAVSALRSLRIFRILKLATYTFQLQRCAIFPCKNHPHLH